jgi:hypothetical protein
MATRFTLTMTTSIADGETQRAETTAIAEMLLRTAQKIQSTHQTTGTINDKNLSEFDVCLQSNSAALTKQRERM